MTDVQASASSPTHAFDNYSVATADGKARLTALQGVKWQASQHTGIVTYHSKGYVLIIASKAQGEVAISQLKEGALKDHVDCRLLITDTSQGDDLIGGVPAVYATAHAASGHLGRFSVIVNTPKGELNVSKVFGDKRDHYDVVLDFSPQPLITHEVPPPGYYPVGNDNDSVGDEEALSDRLAEALAEIPGLVGDFEKPKYFNYNSSICAHGNSKLTGCTRCLQACPTGAISSLGDLIEVDPFLCQGGGSCATACPTGAITYAYPVVADLLEYIRQVLIAYREAGGTQASLLIYGAEIADQFDAHLVQKMPESLIPIRVEELGSVGMDTWLAALAYGVSSITLWATPQTPVAVVNEVKAQLEYTHAVLQGMGYEHDVLALVQTDDLLSASRFSMLPISNFQAATFRPQNQKRTTLRLALDHLYEHAPQSVESVPLPTGAPFGEIQVNPKACTLCMACTSVCPASALQAGMDEPKLKFVEWNCVQCGLCEQACPESAITRSPRMVYNPDQRLATRVLHEEEAFTCISCGKPFATAKMMDTMREKLKDHWMFKDPEAMRRLQMCEDCRVRDMFTAKMQSGSNGVG